jgi:hypothetical protein
MLFFNKAALLFRGFRWKRDGFKMKSINVIVNIVRLREAIIVVEIQINFFKQIKEKIYRLKILRLKI